METDFATPQWALLISFFRWYPDIMEDLCLGERAEYSNSLLGRVTRRYMARCRETFTYACRGYGKTSCVVAGRCDHGILWPGDITGYYAPVEKQAAPLASKAFASYARNYPLLAAHWEKNSDARDHFKISTPLGSRFVMDIDRGIDTSAVIAEECGQEDRNPFNWSDFRQIALGTVRKQYTVNGQPDPTHVDLQRHYITSASRRENEAYSVCRRIRAEMLAGGSAFALWIPWQAVVLCRMKPASYYTGLRQELTAEQFMRECESRCTGGTEHPLVRDGVLQASRRLMTPEFRHCGDPSVFYIIGYDVSSRDAASNAMTAVAVLKCSRRAEPGHGGFLKQLVYVADRRPPHSAAEHAALIQQCRLAYSLPEGQTTYLIIDARSYGQSVIEQLHSDRGVGSPPLCTLDHRLPYVSLERPGAVACIYPIQATGTTGTDPNSVMLDYIERELENGNLQLLTPNSAAGLQAYKLRHGITGDEEDAALELPFLKTQELCGQIANLQKKYTTGGWVEAAISRRVNKDMWSALLYACRLAQRLEQEELYGAGRGSRWDLAEEEEREPYFRPRYEQRLGRMALAHDAKREY